MGWLTRTAAVLFASFLVDAVALFYAEVLDQNQMAH